MPAREAHGPVGEAASPGKRRGAPVVDGAGRRDVVDTPGGDGQPGAVRKGRRRAWAVLITITFLSSVGLTIVIPVLPFITLKFVSDQEALGWWVGVLEATYALGAFLVAPLLGGLSDRFGRRPVLIYSVFGAGVGYVLFGIGGSLPLLIAARAIQGLASGDMPALFGYVADITDQRDRAKRFALLGAITGAAFMVGPAIGGFLAKINLNLPVYATAAMCALVGLIAIFILPESLAPENRRQVIAVTELNPVKVVKSAFGRPALRPLLAGFALITVPFVFFVGNSSVLALDTVGWGPTEVGVVLTVNGALDIFIQGVLLAILLPRIGERGVVVAGIAGQLAGCLGLAVCATFLPWPWLLAGAFVVFAAGQGGMGAALEGLMSGAVGPDEQGWLAGCFQSLMSALQVIAPLMAGWLYTSLGHGAPYWAGLVMILAAAVVLYRGSPTVQNSSG
jgi:DHA1 family tetracycline resistance protein-like MFS transporter